MRSAKTFVMWAETITFDLELFYSEQTGKTKCCIVNVQTGKKFSGVFPTFKIFFFSNVFTSTGCSKNGPPGLF